MGCGDNTQIISLNYQSATRQTGCGSSLTYDRKKSGVIVDPVTCSPYWARVMETIFLAKQHQESCPLRTSSVLSITADRPVQKLIIISME